MGTYPYTYITSGCFVGFWVLTVLSLLVVKASVHSITGTSSVVPFEVHS